MKNLLEVFKLILLLVENQPCASFTMHLFCLLHCHSFSLISDADRSVLTQEG